VAGELRTLRRTRVLLVDDDPLMRRALTAVLVSDGFVMTTRLLRSRVLESFAAATVVQLSGQSLLRTRGRGIPGLVIGFDPALAPMT